MTGPAFPARGLAARLALWALFFGAALLAAYLVLSRAGLVSVNAGVDWAHHAALTDVLALGEDVEARRAQLGEFSDHPRLAQRAAALLARATGLSPLRTLHIVATAAVIASAAIAAARLALLVFTAARGAAAFAGAAAGVTVLWAFSQVAAGFAGQIQYNFFYSQAVATALALLMLVAVQLAVARAGAVALAALAAAPAGAYLLAATHAAPALWFGASAAVCALSLAGGPRRRIGAALAVGAASAALIAVHPSTRALMRIGQQGGGDLNLLPLGRIWQLNLSLAAIVAGLLALAGSLVLLAALLRRRGTDWRSSLLHAHCGAIGLLAVAVPVLANLLVSANQGYYAAAKYVYLFGAEAALVAAHLAAAAWRARAAAAPASGVAVAALAAALLVQDWWSLRWSHSQAHLMALRDDLMQVRAAIGSPAPWPILEGLSVAERFYVYVSPMARARDADAFALLFDPDLAAKPAAQSRLLPASLVPRVAPVWPGNEIRFAAAAPYPQPVLVSGRWGPPTEHGRWSTGPRAQLSFRVPPAALGQMLCVRLMAPTLEDVTLAASLAVNGSAPQVESFRGPGASRVTALPLSSLGPSGDVLLALANRFEPAGNGDDRRVGAGIASIWIAPRCRES